VSVPIIPARSSFDAQLGESAGAWRAEETGAAKTHATMKRTADRSLVMAQILIRKAKAFAPQSNSPVTTLRATLPVVFCAFALLAGGSAPLSAAPQQPAAEPPVSLDRIKEELARAPGSRLKLDVPIPPPRPTFKSRVDQRAFVLTLEEALHRDFDLNDLQRQSAEWRSKCCGLSVGQLVDAIDKVMKQRKIRKTREQIWRELAELEAAARKKL
jgi:hypothetical protein